MHIFRDPPRAKVLQLLAECDLPADDLMSAKNMAFLGCGDSCDPEGVIGLELCGKEALLRSLAVTSGARGSGCGAALVEELECLASQKGVHELYLLTNTAEDFFARRGYDYVERKHAPESIQATAEFSTLCPDDAVVMKKTVAEN